MTLSVDQLHLLVMNVGKSIHNADWNWVNVRSPFLRIYYVVEGEAEVEIRRQRHLLTPGHLYLIPAHVTHSDRCRGPFIHYYAHVYEDRQSQTGQLESFSLPFEMEASGLDRMLFERLIEINPAKRLQLIDPKEYDNLSTLLKSIHENHEDSCPLMIENRGIIYILLSKFLGRAVPMQRVFDDRIGEALKYIRTHIMENLEIQEIARNVGLSKDHFIRLFHKEVGETPTQFIIGRKIEKAELLLITESTPIKSIAYALSFKDSSYFNRVFKKHTGMTPLVYRKSNYNVPQ